MEKLQGIPVIFRLLGGVVAAIIFALFCGVLGGQGSPKKLEEEAQEGQKPLTE